MEIISNKKDGNQTIFKYKINKFLELKDYENLVGVNDSSGQI